MTFPGIAERILTGILIVVLTFLIVITTVDVIGRGIFNAPLPSAYELTQLLMAASVFLALPLVTARGEHVTITALEGVMPPFFSAIRTVAVNLLSAVVLGGLSWRLFLQGERLMDSGNVTMFLRAPLYPVAYGAGVLTGVCALIFMARIFTGSPAPRPDVDIRP